MSTLHIIYDPTDRITQNPEMNKRFRIKAATLSVGDLSQYSETEAEDIARQLAFLLITNLSGAA